MKIVRLVELNCRDDLDMVMCKFANLEDCVAIVISENCCEKISGARGSGARILAHACCFPTRQTVYLLGEMGEHIRPQFLTGCVNDRRRRTDDECLLLAASKK